MENRYKTVFIPSQLEKSSVWTAELMVNGDAFSRDIQAAIDEMQLNGFKLLSLEIVTSTKNSSGGMAVFSSGAILIFEKLDK